MRIFLWFKWLLVAVVFCAALLPAVPFTYIAVWLMPTKTRQFFTDLGAQLARNYAVDVSRLKGR